MAIVTNKQAAGLAVAGVLGVLYVRGKAKSAAQAFNPANPENVVRNVVTNTVGESNRIAAEDFVFSALTLFNPFADDTTRDYAYKVLNREN